MNPARTLGPAIVTKEFDSYFWIYFVGPVVGSILAAGLYRLLVAMYVTSVPLILHPSCRSFSLKQPSLDLADIVVALRAYWAASSEEEEDVVEYLYAVPTSKTESLLQRRTTADLRRSSTSPANVVNSQQQNQTTSTVYGV